jgi:predicted HTH domain antitoxin
MKVITARIEDKYFKDLEMIEKEEHTERAEIMRKLLAKAIKDWKIKKAMELLKERKATLRKAAKLADVSYVEILDLASKADIDIGYTLKDLSKDLA